MTRWWGKGRDVVVASRAGGKEEEGRGGGKWGKNACARVTDTILTLSLSLSSQGYEEKGGRKRGHLARKFTRMKRSLTTVRSKRRDKGYR